MKRIVRTITTVAAMFAATIAMGHGPKLETDGISKSLVFKWDGAQEMTTIRFSDKAGHIIYSDFVGQGEDYGKRFNLESLDAGDYSFKVENTYKEIIYSLRLNEKGILIFDEDENLKPFFKKEDGMVYLNLLNLHREEVKVTVFDSLGRTLYRETFRETAVIEKAFNFKHAFEGAYTIVVKRDGRTYYETIAI